MRDRLRRAKGPTSRTATQKAIVASRNSEIRDVGCGSRTVFETSLRGFEDASLDPCKAAAGWADAQAPLTPKFVHYPFKIRALLILLASLSRLRFLFEQFLLAIGPEADALLTV
jgi:hypothetical protein